MFHSRAPPVQTIISYSCTVVVPPSGRKTKTSPSTRPEKSRDTNGVFKLSQRGALLSSRHASVGLPLSRRASSSASIRFSMRLPAPLASLSTIPVLLTASCWGYFSWSGGRGRVDEHAQLEPRAAEDSTKPCTDDEIPHDNLHPAWVAKLGSHALSLSSV